MAISQKILSDLQKAGHSIHQVQQELAVLAAEQVRGVQKALSNSGSAAQADTLFEAWKQSAHLAHELAEINYRLAGVYATATGETLASKKKGKQAKRRKVSALTTSAPASGKQPVLRGNNTKLLSFLERVRNREMHMVATQSQMSDGAAILLGSVAYSVGRLISMNLMEEGQTGLAESPDAVRRPRSSPGLMTVTQCFLEEGFQSRRSA